MYYGTVCIRAQSPKLLQPWWQVILFAVSIANHQGEIVLIQIVRDMNLVDYLLTRRKVER